MIPLYFSRDSGDLQGNILETLLLLMLVNLSKRNDAFMELWTCGVFSTKISQPLYSSIRGKISFWNEVYPTKSVYNIHNFPNTNGIFSPQHLDVIPVCNFKIIS